MAAGTYDDGSTASEHRAASDGGIGVQGSLAEWMPEAFTTTGDGAASTQLTERAGCGFQVHAVQSAANVSYRQLDYWARTGLVEPSLRIADGSGSQRLYSFADIVTVRVIKRLLDTGVSLRNVRVAAEYLRRRGGVDLGSVTLVCDGVSVYECTDENQIVDLLSGGQGVFGIAIGHTVTEVADAVRYLPTVTVDPELGTADGAADAAGPTPDELAARRTKSRKTA